MQKQCQNIYQAARRAAGMTCEKAAMVLAVSDSTLRKYEAGSMPVPDRLALEMAKAYKAPWLRVQHLQSNEVFTDLMGRFSADGGKARSVLALQKEVGDVERCFPEIIGETLDGTGLSGRLVRECREACAALLAVFGAEREAAPAGGKGGSLAKEL